MDNYVFVQTINIGKIKDKEFNLSDEKNAHLLEHCKISINGDILAVSRDKVGQYVNQKDIYLARMKLRPMPKEFVIKDDEDFWKFMAHLVDVDEDI